MSCLAPFTSFFQSTKRIDQSGIRCEPQRQNYSSSPVQVEAVEPFLQGITQGQPTTSCLRLAPFACFLHSTKKIGQSVIRGESQRQSPHSTVSIHILDDDSLLGIFNLYRPAIFDGDEDVHIHIAGGKKWDRERWWYKLAQVCRRWRNLILGSASHLGLCLVCTYGTPVADMLSHSPSLPLIVDYFHDYRDITTEDEEGIIIALKQRHRVRRIRLWLPILKLQKLIMSIDDEYPMLEYLVMEPPLEDKYSAMVFPKTLQAPHLRHASLIGFVLPTVFRLLTTAMGLVVLCLHMEHPSAYFQPNTLLEWVSSMPQLETLLVFFFFPVPNPDVEMQLMHTPITTHVTLPNLRSFEFQGVSAYMEAVVRWIVTPRLERLLIEFFEELTFSLPHLLQFVNATKTLRFDSATFEFSREKVYTRVHLREEAESAEMLGLHLGLFIKVCCWGLDWQVSSVVQIFNSLDQISSTVEHLTLDHTVNSRSLEEHNEVDHAEWRSFLRSFSNVKTLRVDDGLVKELSRCLPLDDGELPLELLPELQELTHSGSGDRRDAFTPFIDARRHAGHPVTLVRLNSGSVTPISRSSSPGFSELSLVTPSGSGEAGNVLGS